MARYVPWQNKTGHIFTELEIKIHLCIAEPEHGAGLNEHRRNSSAAQSNKK